MKRLLMVVDYQNDFVSGSLGFEKATLLEKGICQRINECKKNGDTIAFTLDTHEESYLNTREGKHLPIAHCIDNTNGHKLYGAVYEKSEGCLVFRKATFGSEELFDYLRKNPYDEIEIAGVVTNICVISNAILTQTALPNANVIINTTLCASNDETLHQKAIEIMRNLHMEIKE